jgi:UDP-N-acetylmuramoyl-tripeptide--D-alanyl-D-alanine ligase
MTPPQSLPLWTSLDADTATGGQSTAPWVANGVSIDTRTLGPGDLFIALKDMRDGHDSSPPPLAKVPSPPLSPTAPQAWPRMRPC